MLILFKTYSLVYFLINMKLRCLLACAYFELFALYSVCIDLTEFLFMFMIFLAFLSISLFVQCTSQLKKAFSRNLACSSKCNNTLFYLLLTQYFLLKCAHLLKYNFFYFILGFFVAAACPFIIFVAHHYERKMCKFLFYCN